MKKINKVIDDISKSPKFRNKFNSYSLHLTFLNFFRNFLFTLCQIERFFFASFSHGNFSPGSLFLSGAISE